METADPRHLGLSRKRLVAGLALLVAGLSSAAIAQADNALMGSVKLGATPVPEALVAHALQACEQASPDEERLACLKRAWIPRWLIDRDLQEHPDTLSLISEQENQLLYVALVESLSQKLPEPKAAEIDAYLKKHQRDFEKPLRLRLFRILVATEEEATALLSDLGENVNIEAYRKAARAHSLDTATLERGGDLGFVWPDGSTDIPQVSAEKSLYQAALELKDGQIARQPLPEGDRFAVLWRRGSLAAQELNDESRQLARQRLREAELEKQLATLLKQEAKKVIERKNILLGKLRRKGPTLFQEP